MSKNDPFLPENYKQPKLSTGGYMKLLDGTNKFRVLTPALLGYEYWTQANKPVRSAQPFTDTPADARLNDEGQFRQKHFWAFVVWNYKEHAVQILEITQATIQRSINDLVSTEEWGDPQEYDLTISRTGEDLLTKYTVQPSPHKELDPEIAQQYEEMDTIHLKALLEGADPFNYHG